MFEYEVTIDRCSDIVKGRPIVAFMTTAQPNPQTPDPQKIEQQWRAGLADWAIPEHIMAQAPTNPWIHPVGQFTVVGPIADSPSHLAARRALPPGGSVLDIGCGGGRAALALIPPAGHIIGVDHQPGMLAAFAEAADARGVTHEEILGDWPDVAHRTPSADVVVCHHVAYNVADLGAFITELSAHAHHRVVIELPMQHPLTWMNPLWKHFWDIDRPTTPTAHDALAIIRGRGYDAHLEQFAETGSRSNALDPQAQAEATCVRLCLPIDRTHEVIDAMSANDESTHPSSSRPVATIWWDTEAGRT